jgi:diacylglycerol kinase family enzyme
MLEIPQGLDAQVRMLLDGTEQPIDLLRATGADGSQTYVAGSVYAGVDAHAAEIVDRSRWLPNTLQYPLAAIRAIAAYRPVQATLEVDGVCTTYRAATVVIANSRFYGKGMAIAPNASVTDGLLDVVVIEAASRLELLRSFPKVYDGRHINLREVTVVTGREVRLSGSYLGGAAVPVGADGEPLSTLPAGDAALSVELLPGAVRILR